LPKPTATLQHEEAAKPRDLAFSPHYIGIASPFRIKMQHPLRTKVLHEEGMPHQGLSLRFFTQTPNKPGVLQSSLRGISPQMHRQSPRLRRFSTPSGEESRHFQEIG
jgi:hypothetical protein